MPRSSRWRAWSGVGSGAGVRASLVLLAVMLSLLAMPCRGGVQEHLAAPRAMTPRRLGAVVLLYAAVGAEGSTGGVSRWARVSRRVRTPAGYLRHIAFSAYDVRHERSTPRPPARAGHAAGP